MAKKSEDGPSKSQIIKDYFKANPGTMPKDVVAGIKKESGVDVTIPLVNNVKYNLKKGSKSKGRKAKAKTKAGSGKHGEKAQAIRVTLGKLGRKAKAPEVIADLKAQGITASYSQVYTIRKTLFKRGRRLGVSATPTVATGETIAMEHLLEAKRLAEKLGGIEAARHALSALSKLQ